MFSKACEYGLRSIIYIAQQSEQHNKVGVKDIAKAIKSPEAFTGKILQKLTKQKLVKSIKGPYGGFVIEQKDMKNIKLSDVIILFDGKLSYSGCILGLDYCDAENPCPLHEKSVDILTDIKELLENQTIYDILYTDDKLNYFWLKRN